MSKIVSVAILSYNTKELTIKCISSVIKYTKGIDYEIIVVDNNSQDFTQDALRLKFPNINLIQNNYNNYFAKASNQALKEATGKYFLMLNSDTYLIDNSIKKMIGYMEKNNIVACEGMELDLDRKIINTSSRLTNPLIDFYELSILGKRIADKKMLDRFRMKNLDRRKSFKSEVVNNAFFCIRTELIKRLKGMDENFKLYYTEQDLGKKLKNYGYPVFHYGNAFVVHKKEGSAMLLGWEKLDIYYKDMLFYYIKYGYYGGILLYILLNIEKFFLAIFRPKMFENKY